MRDCISSVAGPRRHAPAASRHPPHVRGPGPASHPRPLARGPGCLITGILLTAAPASALACPVCGFIGTSDNTWAYQAMSAMLTLLPLAMVGAIVWWLARLAARAGAERPSATQPASTAHRPPTPNLQVPTSKTYRHLGRWKLVVGRLMGPSLALRKRQIHRGRAVDG
jgi:hypothetical protein